MPLPFRGDPDHNLNPMQLHASCAARQGAGVLLSGRPGSGKSDLLLRLLDHGFQLLADDRVDLDGLTLSAPDPLAGLLEVRGLGIIRLPFAPSARLALVVELGSTDRLPHPARRHGVPLVHIDPAQASAPNRVAIALDCALQHTACVAGAFA